MSVIIKGFDKPSDCDYCTLQEDSYCNVLLSFINVEHGIDTRCPLVEIKGMTDEEFDSILARLISDRKTEPRKEQNFCGKCRYLYRDFKYGLSCYRLMDNEPCKYEDRKTEPTGYNLSPVDKDINVRSKDEPTTQTETQNSNLTFEKRTMRDCYNCKRYETEEECIECHYEPMETTDYCDICKRDMCEACIADATNPYCVPSHYEINYEPKTEPQTERSE